MRSIVTGIIFMIGGMSGALVLRGTNSSAALVVVGVVLVVIGVMQQLAKAQ